MSDLQLKLGRLAAVRPVGLRDLATYATDPFPTPPDTFSAPSFMIGMDGNDTLGDCTIAGVDHLIGAWNVDFNESDARPTLAELEAQYSILSPGDQGCVEATVLQTWQTTGLFDMPTGPSKIKAYAPVNYRNPVELRQVTAFLGGVYLGIACPQSMQTQFAAGQPITYVPGSPIEGGHCIVGVGYTAAGLLCATWGQVVEVEWLFFRHYLEEAWAILSDEIAEAGADTLGIDVAQLEADLTNLPVAA